MKERKVTTVTGEVNGDELGIILPHEHLHMQFDVCAIQPPSHIKSWPVIEADKEWFQLQHLGLLRQYPYSVPYNLKLNDNDSQNVVLDEIMKFKELGGRTIVENTVHGISRNETLLKKLSLQSGLNIVCGTGFYVAASQRPSQLNTSIEEIYDVILKELNDGLEDGIKCGIIGEIGCSWPLHTFEKNMIQAVAKLQKTTQKPVTFHPGRNSKCPFEIIRIFTEAGGNAKDVVMCHLDRTIFDDDQLLDFASLDTFTQYDLFGTECSFYQISEEIDMLSDAQRIKKLELLRDHGKLEQILMSHDIHTKHRLVNFGGHGFGHILQNIVPKMKLRGFTSDDLDTILMKNPRRWLCGGQA